MKENLNKLLSNASSSLYDHAPEVSEKWCNSAGLLANDLLKMLSQRNGFYAFESALHVFPSNSFGEEIGIDDWNEKSLWRDAYKGLADNCLFFAEDIFGVQFCIKENKIHTFDPETGALDHLANDIEEWAKLIINDYEMLTGFSFAHEWQNKNGSILAGKRLTPKIPFVLGGQFELDNLYLSDAVDAMKFRANIAVQIKDLPDGTQIKLNITD